MGWAVISWRSTSKTGHGNEERALALGSLHNGRAKFGLIAGKVQAGTVLDHEWIAVVEGVAGQSVGSGGGNELGTEGELHELETS